MRSLKQYIKIIEATENPPDGWIANIIVDYEFPSGTVMIPQRAQQLESTIDDILTGYQFYTTGSGGGLGARDISYSLEGLNLAELLAVAKQAEAEVQQLANRIESNNAALGIVGLELSVGGFIMDSDYENNFSFEEAEEIVRQSQQLGKS